MPCHEVDIIALRTMVTLQQVRMAEAQRLPPVDQERSVEKSALALSSSVNMICEICAKFNTVATSAEAELVPLSAVICTGTAALAAIQMNQPREHLDVLKQSLTPSCERWKLARNVIPVDGHMIMTLTY